MQILKKITSITLAIIIFTMVPIVIFLMITAHSGILFGIRTYNVLTGSMEPTIHVGSSILTIPSSQYEIGDIITFKRRALTITHRIFGIKNGQFITKGDANKSADPLPVDKMLVIGKDYLIVPYVGRFIDFVKTVPGFLLFIALPILIFVGFEVINIKSEMEKEIEKKVMARMKPAEQTV
jgi:signal peptidase